MKYILLLVILVSPIVVLAQDGITSPFQLLQQSERRQAVIDKKQSPGADGRIHIDFKEAPLPPMDAKTTCFSVDKLQVNSTDSKQLPPKFFRYLSGILKEENILAKKQSKNSFLLYDKPFNLQKAPCLTAVRIERITTKLQNKLIKKGFITSRVLVPGQNLKEGHLIINITAGRLGELYVNKGDISQTYANRATLYNAFPTRTGKLLNLRDLEQGLENLRRLPTVSAEMDVIPGKVIGTSDIAVRWKQRKYPFRLNLSIDNSGNKSTGEYLGTFGLSLDNPLHLNDIFSVNYTHSLLPGVEQTDKTGKKDKSKTNNYSINYSVPLGYWSFDFDISDYYYDQIVAGVNRNYHYTGDTVKGGVNLSKNLYRDDKHKFDAKIGFWRKTTKNYINDAEVAVQRRRTAGWSASLLQHSYFKLGTLSSSLTYKRGTRAFGAIPAPEELFNEGTAKMKIWTTDVNWYMPFHMGQQAFSWSSHLHGQWNSNRLTPQDKIAIGGRYSVRGFSGEKTLAGERGWYLRNDMSWNYKPTHQLYVGLDTGRVSGSSAKYLQGKSLTGLALGLKGQFSKRGYWYYDVFAGVPLEQPQGFDADSVIVGFDFSYSL